MSDYWIGRNEESERIKAQFNSDAQYNHELARIYNRAQREIDKEIQSELMSFATREQVSMAEAQRRVDKMDVEAFKEKAKRYVEEKNFSPRANEELRSYNVRMRMSRLELLKHDIHLETVALADEENKLLTARLSEEAQAEFERQAGILGESLPDNLDRIVKQIVVADFQGTDFSERIWRDQKQLRNALSNTLDDVLIRGQHPREASKQLRELVSESFYGKRGNGGAKYVAERLAITESARIQSGIQKASYEEYDIQQYEYLAEPDACDVCGALDGSIFSVSVMQPGINASPMHSHCRCSSSGVVDRQAFESAFEQSEPLDLESDEGMIDWFDGVKDLEDIGIDDPASMYRGMEEELFTENARQIKRLENRFELTEKFDTLKVDTASTGGEVAFVKYGPTTPQNVELNFSKDLYSKPKSLVNMVKDNVESGFFMPAGQSETELALYPITHEYGHLVQTSLFKEELLKNGWSPSNPRQFVDANSLDGRFHWYDKIKNDMAERHYDEIVGIAKRNNPDFSLDDNLSEYGKTIKEEFFAEAFANSQLGKPNEIGKAMNTWLDSKGLITK